MDPRQLKAKCLRILQDYPDVLNYILEVELNTIAKTSVVADTEYETLKRAITNEGIKEGLRRFSQKLNEYAAKDV